MTPLRVVLDTNAVLDWLLFRDKGFAPLAEAIAAGRLALLTSESCLEELRRVLRYPEFKLDEARQAALLAEVRARAEVLEVPEALPVEAGYVVPHCKDPDDQKFLAVAAHAGALLVTKDKVLLKLARKVARAGRFAILRPDEVIRRHCTPPSQ